MSNRIIFAFFTAMTLIVAGTSHSIACGGALQGSGYMLNHNELIDDAKDIFLVRIHTITSDYFGDRGLVISDNRGKIYDENFHKGMWKASENFSEKYEFEVIEILKGTVQRIEPFDNSATHYVSKDFANHRDEIFWYSDVGRSDWHIGSCTPNHTFKMGEIYLYFPDKIAARKSAEIIRSPDDAWLQYVRERVATVTVQESRAK